MKFFNPGICLRVKLGERENKLESALELGRKSEIRNVVV
jgi:hypothetical protein